MKLETIIEYCLSKKGATKSFPFSKLPEVLAFKVGNTSFLPATKRLIFGTKKAMICNNSPAIETIIL